MSQTNAAPPATPGQSRDGWLARAAYGGFAMAGLFVLWQLWHLAAKASPALLEGLIERRGDALIGVPAAAALASFLIGVVRAIDGRIEFETLGLRVKGAGATIVLWISVFLAIRLSIGAVW